MGDQEDLRALRFSFEVLWVGATIALYPYTFKQHMTGTGNTRLMDTRTVQLMR